MAPVATLLGGLVGTIASLVAMIFFDASFAMAAVVYFSTAFCVVCALIASVFLGTREESGFPVQDHQNAALTQHT